MIQYARASTRHLPLWPALLTLLLLGSSAAQEPHPFALSPPDELVYVEDDDAETNRLLETARNAIVNEEWTDAIDSCVEILGNGGNQLAPWGPRTHLNAAETARLLLADLPPEGRKILNRRFEPALRERLDRNTRPIDVVELERLSRSVPVPAMARAAYRLACSTMEEGEWDTALRELNRILFLFPESYDGIPKGEIQARIASCRAHLGGRAFVDPLGRTRTEYEVRVAGKKIPFEELLEKLGKTGGPAPTPWSAFGGNSSHNKIPELDATDLDLWWSFSGFQKGDDPREDPRPLISPELEPNPVLSLFPVTHLDKIFVYNESAAWAIDRETGKAVWQRDLAALCDGEVDEPPKRNYFYGTTGADRYFLLHEYVPEVRETGPRPDRTERILVALHATDGSSSWVRGGSGDPSEFLRDLHFTGPPIVVRDRVYVAGKKLEEGEEEGEIKAYCAAFHAETGELIWNTFLGSSPSKSSHRQVFPEGPALAYGEGLLFCGTDIGILSAVDPSDGRHLWCFRYERIPYRNRDNSRLIYSFLESWSDNPMIVTDARVYLTPGDSRYLHILLTSPERDSGLVQLSRVNKAQYRYLIGVQDRTVYLAGRDESGSYHMVSAFHPEGGERANLWDFPIPNPLPNRQPPLDLPSGRGILSGNRVYFPTYKGIYVLDAARGDLLSHVQNPDGGKHRFGNLLVAGDEVISAFRLQVNSFRASDG